MSARNASMVVLPSARHGAGSKELAQGTGSILAGAAAGFLIGGPVGAVIGGLVVAPLTERVVDEALDSLRGEDGVPASETITPDGNHVVQPTPHRSNTVPAPLFPLNDESLGHMGHRTEPLIQPSSPTEAYRAAIRTQLEGVEEPQAPPSSQLPAPG